MVAIHVVTMYLLLYHIRQTQVNIEIPGFLSNTFIAVLNDALNDFSDNVILSYLSFLLHIWLKA